MLSAHALMASALRSLAKCRQSVHVQAAGCLRIQGFRVLGFRVLGLRVLGFRVIVPLQQKGYSPP